MSYGPWKEQGARDISNVTVVALGPESWRGHGRGCCMRCGELNTKPMHHTYWMGHGSFPLCEECWSSLTPEARVPFYTMLWAVWVGQSPQDIDRHIAEWPAMCAAVLAGG